MKPRNSDKRLKRTAYIRALSERANEAQLRDGSKVFADAHLYRTVMNRIFTAYLAGPDSPRDWSQEFVRVYKHLLDGGSVTTMPATSLDPDVIAELGDMVQGDDTRRETE